MEKIHIHPQACLEFISVYILFFLRDPVTVPDTESKPRGEDQGCLPHYEETMEDNQLHNLGQTLHTKVFSFNIGKDRYLFVVESMMTTRNPSFVRGFVVSI